MATHLVTGGAGFLGNLTARALAARGEKVRVLDILDVPDLPGGIEAIRADILDLPRVTEAMQGVDVVHHAAAMVPLTKAGDQFRRVNVEGTENALAAARRTGVKMFIHISTSAVFGVPDRCPITDDTPVRPVETYGRAKLEGERRVIEAARDGMPTAIVRPRTIIGLGRLGIFQILFDWIREGRRIYVLGDGNQLFQLLYADDIVDFMLLLAEQRKAGIYNIGAQHFRTLREDLDALIAHAGSSSRVVGVPAAPAIALLGLLDRLKLSPLAPWHYLTYHKPFHFDISRPMRELGWQPRYSNEQALAETYDWFVANQREARQAGGASTHRKPVKQGILRILKSLS